MLSTKYYMIKRASEELKAKGVEDQREELLRKLTALKNTRRSILGWAPVLGGAAAWGIGGYRGSKSPIKDTLSGMGGGLVTSGLIDALFINPKIRKVKKQLFELYGMPTDMI